MSWTLNRPKFSKVSLVSLKVSPSMPPPNKLAYRGRRGYRFDFGHQPLARQSGIYYGPGRCPCPAAVAGALCIYNDRRQRNRSSRRTISNSAAKGRDKVANRSCCVKRTLYITTGYWKCTEFRSLKTRSSVSKNDSRKISPLSIAAWKSLSNMDGGIR